MTASKHHVNKYFNNWVPHSWETVWEPCNMQNQISSASLQGWSRNAPAWNLLTSLQAEILLCVLIYICWILCFLLRQWQKWYYFSLEGSHLARICHFCCTLLTLWTKQSENRISVSFFMPRYPALLRAVHLNHFHFFQHKEMKDLWKGISFCRAECRVHIPEGSPEDKEDY